MLLIPSEHVDGPTSNSFSRRLQTAGFICYFQQHICSADVSPCIEVRDEEERILKRGCSKTPLKASLCGFRLVLLLLLSSRCVRCACVCDGMDQARRGALHILCICDLSLSPQRDEVITLQPFVSLSLSRCASIKLIGEDSSRRRCCFVIARRRQIYSDVSLLLSMNSELLVCYFGGGCEKRRSLPPLLPSSMPIICASPSNVNLHLHGEMIAKEARYVYCCQINFQCGLGSEWNYLMIARNNWECWQKWPYTEIIIITLKDLQWQREERQQGLCVIVGQIVPSVDCAVKTATDSEQSVLRSPVWG